MSSYLIRSRRYLHLHCINNSRQKPAFFPVRIIQSQLVLNSSYRSSPIIGPCVFINNSCSYPIFVTSGSLSNRSSNSMSKCIIQVTDSLTIRGSFLPSIDICKPITYKQIFEHKSIYYNSGYVHLLNSLSPQIFAVSLSAV